MRVKRSPQGLALQSNEPFQNGGDKTPLLTPAPLVRISGSDTVMDGWIVIRYSIN